MGPSEVTPAATIQGPTMSCGAFPELWARLRDGDANAAAEVHRRFTRRLIALAGRRRLRASIGEGDEAEDAVQSAYKSFFARQAGIGFDLDDWDRLWDLLALITVRKCNRRLERARAPRRDRGAARLGAVPGVEVLDREPTPLEAATLAELVEGMLRGLDAEDRRIAERLLQGDTGEEAAARCGRSERTVRRVRQRLKRRLERLGAVEGEGA